MESTEKQQGKVKWFDETKGYGFIERAGERDVFIHHTDIQSDQPGRKSVKMGQVVEFSVKEANRGPQAVDLTVVE